MATKDKARGKALERWVAGRIGWRRRRSGENANGYDDNVLMDGSLAPVSIECKSHAVLQLRTEWINQARQNGAGRPWALVQRPLGWREPVVTSGFGFWQEMLEAWLEKHHTTNHFGGNLESEEKSTTRVLDTNRPCSKGCFRGQTH